MTLWKNLVVALVAAFALAACSSSNDNGGTTGMQDQEPQPMAVDTSGIHDDATIEAFSDTIQPGGSTTRGDVTYTCASDGDACRIVVMANGTTTSTGGMATATNSDTFEEKLAAQRGQEDAENQVTALEEQQEAKQAREDAAMAAKLFTALNAGAPGGRRALPTVGGNSREVEAKYNMPAAISGFTLDVPSTTPSPDVTLTRRATVKADGKLGNWQITDVQTGTNHIRAYTNVEAPKSVDFVDWLTDLGLSLTGGAVASADLTANPAHVAASAFAGANELVTHEHNKDTDTSTPGNETYQTTGTFGGAAGTYTCTGTCTSRRANADGGVTLSGTWTFTADGSAMAQVADSDYLSFGWWLYQDSGGSYHVGLWGQETGHDASTGLNGLIGTATYEGKAAGKYAVYESGTAKGGAFTADATLEVNFGDNDTSANSTVEGMIDNFDGDGMSGWTVKLNTVDLNGTGVAMGNLGGDANLPDSTVWTMGDNPAAPSGNWDATFYGGTANKAPIGALGTFEAEHGHVGRMAGAFGVEYDGK